MSRAVEYEVYGRAKRRRGLGQVPDVLRDLTAEDLSGETPLSVATPAEEAPPVTPAGFLGLPMIVWVGLLGALVFLGGGRR